MASPVLLILLAATLTSAFPPRPLSSLPVDGHFEDEAVDIYPASGSSGPVRYVLLRADDIRLRGGGGEEGLSAILKQPARLGYFELVRPSGGTQDTRRPTSSVRRPTPSNRAATDYGWHRDGDEALSIESAVVEEAGEQEGSKVQEAGGGGEGTPAEAARPDKVEEAVVVGEESSTHGPSVAQAKPQAIAMAGVGGVAAASPVATAIVGPGGMAVAAPSATAVAGQTGSGGGGPHLASIPALGTAHKAQAHAERKQQRLGMVAFNF